MHQVLCGVDFLHQNRIIHRDLKPQNLLVDRFHRIKIADFGLARTYDFNMKLTTMVVTLWYRAPEVLLSNSYATPVDVWSCGCIFAELYRRRPLFEGLTEGDQLQRIFDVIGKPLESEWPRDVSLSLTNFRDHVGKPLVDVVPEISPDAVDLLRKLLKFVPGTRICASDALKHPYFRGLTPPRVTASSNRSTPTQQLLGGSTPLTRASTTASSSPFTHRHTSSSTTTTSTVASTAVVTAHSPITSSATSQANSSSSSSSSSGSSSSSNVDVSSASGDSSNSSKQSSTNDENNPNAGNSTARPSSNNNNASSAPALVMMSDPKLSEKGDAPPAPAPPTAPQMPLAVRPSGRSPHHALP
ncbi:UNVERIFIED_CONTAM: hypothetical protein GTU68_006054 [Idotea baltica]|nr:hypothetical protein [Idotea baltica]